MIDGWVTNLHPIREGHLQHNIVRPFFRLVGRWCFAFWLVSLGNGLPRVEPSKLWSTSTIMWLKKGDASEPEHETGGPVMLSSSPLWLVKNDWKLGPSRVGGEGRAFHLSPVLFSAEKSISISWGRGNLQSSSFLLNSVYFAIQKKRDMSFIYSAVNNEDHAPPFFCIQNYGFVVCKIMTYRYHLEEICEMVH